LVPHLDHQTATDVQDLAMNVVGERRAEEVDRPRRLLGGAGTAHRDHGAERFASALGDAVLDLLAAAFASDLLAEHHRVDLL
jgi:hypothetical protein